MPPQRREREGMRRVVGKVEAAADRELRVARVFQSVTSRFEEPFELAADRRLAMSRFLPAARDYPRSSSLPTTNSLGCEAMRVTNESPPLFSRFHSAGFMTVGLIGRAIAASACCSAS